MNFLAHALLAGENPALIVGGVIGDWIKGPLPGILPADLAQGVALHRAIDSYAETDAAFCKSRTRVSPLRRRYAGVLVDIFYDHLLARNWHVIHPQPLPAYTAGIYAMIEARLHELPQDAHRPLQRMAEENWLLSYAEIEGIADVLRRMSRRARQPNPLAEGELELLADRDGFQQDFDSWLAATRTYARQWQTDKLYK